MKSKKISKILSFACLTPCVGFCTYSLVSCDKKGVESISLEAKTTTLIAGDEVQINARFLPLDEVKNDKVTWSCSKTQLNEPFLTQKGLFVVPSETKIPDITRVTITATLISNPEIKGSIELTLNPETVDGFHGFQDSKITYAYKRKIDLQTGKYETKQVDIIRPDPVGHPLQFKTAHPIDWFTGLMETKLSPIGDRQFSFVPIFSEGVAEQDRQMMFTHTNGEPRDSWILDFEHFREYTEGEMTPTIPDANIRSPNGKIESITTRFAIDKGVSLELIIEGYVYLAPSQDSERAVISYDKQPDDPHDIVNHEAGNYETNIFCPSDKSRHVYRESMSTIYIHKKYFEYLDLTITPVLNTNIPQELLDMFNYKLDILREVRPNDGFPYYRCYFYYTFDLDKMGNFDPAKEGYENYNLLSLEVRDEALSYSFEAELKFNIQWV